jgi:hypothetical protein
MLFYDDEEYYTGNTKPEAMLFYNDEEYYTGNPKP